MGLMLARGKKGFPAMSPTQPPPPPGGLAMLPTQPLFFQCGPVANMAPDNPQFLSCSHGQRGPWSAGGPSVSACSGVWAPRKAPTWDPHLPWTVP